MGQPVVHFEIIGKDGEALQKFYSDVFGWELDTIGFAVPVDTVSRLLPQLIRYGRIKQPGIAGASLVSDAIARSNGIEGVAICMRSSGRIKLAASGAVTCSTGN